MAWHGMGMGMALHGIMAWALHCIALHGMGMGMALYGITLHGMALHGIGTQKTITIYQKYTKQQQREHKRKRSSFW
jgi:hypothetical protein